MKIFILTVISLLLIFLVLNAGYYKVWFADKPMLYLTDFLKQKDDSLSLEAIRTERYGVSYTICMKVKEFVNKRKLNNPVILFEPNSYYRDSLHMPIRVPEPAVFYYYTGLQGVWMNSGEVSKARFLVRISKKGVNMDEIKSPAQLSLILNNYRKFTPIL